LLTEGILEEKDIELTKKNKEVLPLIIILSVVYFFWITNNLHDYLSIIFTIVTILILRTAYGLFSDHYSSHKLK